MSKREAALFGDPLTTQRIIDEIAVLDTANLLRFVIEDLFAGRVALVSSFGADSAVLLHLVAQIDKALPIIFADTLQLFPETQAHRDALVARCGLTNVKTIRPDAGRLAKEDPENFLWAQDADRCCQIRKVQPMAKALHGYDAWISGRKRFQSQTRTALPLFETEGERVKINPLAGWDEAAIEAYFVAHALPRHALFAKGYLSIGCVPCTSPVKRGEDQRAGRWRGAGKTECGLHVGPLEAALRDQDGLESLASQAL